MRRRAFMAFTGALSAGSLLADRLGSDPAARTGARSRTSDTEPPRAKDVAEWLRAIVPVDEPSVDRIVIGDPETVVSGIGTCWLPYRETCERAVREGVNLLVVHEPTFYTHWDLDEKSPDLFAASAAGRKAYLEAVAAKKRWILDNRLVVIRCHDVLDKVGGWGIPFAFGEVLGFRAEDIVRSRPYYNVYRIVPRPAVEVARGIAARLAGFRQPGVAFYGDRARVVGTVGVGTGCYCDPIEFMDLAPDLFIALDDIVRTWTQTVFARDTGRPLVVINHGTSEEAGVRALSARLKKAYAELKVVHYAQGCGYEWIKGDSY